MIINLRAWIDRGFWITWIGYTIMHCIAVYKYGDPILVVLGEALLFYVLLSVFRGRMHEWGARNFSPM